MIAHITYLSEDALQRKFGRKLQSKEIISLVLMQIFKLKVILRYQGKSFVDRFDANSYLYITRAMDYFDVTKLFPQAIELNSNLNKHINYFIISFSSDWLFPTKENLQIVEILNRNTCKVSYTEMKLIKGHDSFLLDEPELDRSIMGFLNSNFEKLLEKINDIYTQSIRKDWNLIESLIDYNSTILDVGCGEGGLILQLKKNKHANTRGLEIDGNLVRNAISEWNKCCSRKC